MPVVVKANLTTETNATQRFENLDLNRTGQEAALGSLLVQSSGSIAVLVNLQSGGILVSD